MSDELKQKNKGVFGELWSYMKIRKKMWLLPLIILLVLSMAIVIFTQSSAVSVFIYTLF